MVFNTPDGAVFPWIKTKVFSLPSGRVFANKGVFSNVASGGNYDPDAQTYFNNIAAIGGTISSSSMTAANNLVLCMKASGTWALHTEIYPFAGDQLAAALTKLKYIPGHSPYLVNNNLVNGDYIETGITGGLKGDGSTKYFQTGVNALTDVTLSNVGLAVYTSTIDSNGQDANFAIGAFDGTHGLLIQDVMFNSPFSYWFGTANSYGGTPYYNGFLTAQRNGTTVTAYNNGVNSSTLSNTGAAPNFEIWGLGINSSNSTQGLSNKRFQYMSITQALTDAQAASVYNCVQTFQAALNRSIDSDPDVGEWQGNVVNNGGSYSSPTVTALHDLAVGMKTDSIWTKMAGIYPLAGDNLLASQVKLRATNDPTFFLTNNNLISTDYSPTAGITGNGSSKYFSGGADIPSLNQNSVSFGAFTVVDSSGVTANAFSFIGSSYQATGNSNRCYMCGEGTFSAANRVGLGSVFTLAGSAGTGLRSLVYDNTNLQIYQGATSAASQAASGLTWQKTGSFCILTSGTQYSNATIGFAFVSTALTPTDMTNLNNRVTTFMTALGRLSSGGSNGTDFTQSKNSSFISMLQGF